MTQVNLLPGDVKERQRLRRITSLVILGAAAGLALLLFVFVLQSARLSSAKQELTAQTAANAALQAKIVKLQPFQDLKDQVAQRQALVASVKTDEVAWSGVLRDVSMIIPDKMWLTAMTATTTELPAATAPPVSAGANGTTNASPSPSPSPSGTTTTTPPQPTLAAPSLVANIQFQGMASDYPTVALWLTRLEQIHGWVNAWISTAQRQVQSDAGAATDPNATKVQFAGTIDLTVAATINGGKQ